MLFTVSFSVTYQLQVKYCFKNMIIKTQFWIVIILSVYVSQFLLAWDFCPLPTEELSWHVHWWVGAMSIFDLLYPYSFLYHFLFTIFLFFVFFLLVFCLCQQVMYSWHMMLVGSFLIFAVFCFFLSSRVIFAALCTNVGNNGTLTHEHLWIHDGPTQYDSNGQGSVMEDNLLYHLNGQQDWLMFLLSSGCVIQNC